ATVRGAVAWSVYDPDRSTRSPGKAAPPLTVGTVVPTRVSKIAPLGPDPSWSVIAPLKERSRTPWASTATTPMKPDWGCSANTDTGWLVNMSWSCTVNGWLSVGTP